ncbi:MAG: ATP-dependent protease subunit HslV [Bacillota bacterium]|jgi:ATP-dependent HslUV protease subunit HslV|nr:ATP-dependent protease subunit HslV [Candidatus Fermentithermobacillaceae bacterium]
MTVESKPFILGTTVLAVRARGKAAMAGDGQVTLETNHTILKSGARKVRKLYKNSVIAGFAGSVGDALTLFDKLEGHLEETRGDLPRATVNLAKEWRTDRVLRQLKAMLLCMDKQHLLLVSGTGEVIEPDEPVLAIGSGGAYAMAAAKALMRFTDMDGADIAREALKIAASICIYTNDNIVVEELG